MKINSINSEKIVDLCNNLDNVSSEINDYLNKIDQLIDMLPSVFNDSQAKIICSNVTNNQIINIKNNVTKINNMSIALKEIDLAYREVDERFKERLSK